MKTAFIFPGQGSQVVGMGKDLFDSFRESREVFELADAVMGMSLSDLCFSGPEEDLRLTANTQPAILTVSIAALRALQQHVAGPNCVAGHSLGEYSALVAAESLTFEDAVAVVRKRGIFMQDAVPPDEGAMAAVLGLDLDTVAGICQESSVLGVCCPANLNTPGQIVIAGSRPAVEKAVELAQAKGARRSVLLQVSAPFHCSLMEPAAVRLASVLEDIEFRDLRMPLITNVDAKSITGGSDARDALVRQVSAPVRWNESVSVMIADGVTRFVEFGPGKVLAGLVKKISKDVDVLSVADSESLEVAIERLGGGRAQHSG